MELVRYWYENGVLKKETPMKNSLVHGVVKQWDSTGNLIDASEFSNGSGERKTFYENGMLQGQMTLRQGYPEGRLRCWDEDGELIVERYFLKGRPVSRKRYESEAATDSSLATYADDNQTSWEEKTQQFKSSNNDLESVQVDDVSGEHERETVQELLSLGPYSEALTWLRKGFDCKEQTRFLGEGMSITESIEFIEKLYKAGASKVFVLEITQEDEGIETSDKLLVNLDRSSKLRTELFKLCNEVTINEGFLPDEDIGQNHIFLKL